MQCWVWSNQLLNCNFRQHLRHCEYWNATQRWINFWIVTLPTSRLGTTFLGLEYLYEKTKHVVSPSGLNFEFPMKNNRRNLNWLHLTVHLPNNNSVWLNTKFETETKFAILFLNYRKNWTFSQYRKLNFITNEYTNFPYTDFPLSLQWG